MIEMSKYIINSILFSLIRMNENVENHWSSKQEENVTYETSITSFGTRKQSSYGMKNVADDIVSTLMPQMGSVGKHFRRYNWTEIERVDVTDLQVRLKGLKPFTQYEILLQAFNRYGRGPVAKIEAFTAGDGKKLMILRKYF